MYELPPYPNFNLPGAPPFNPPKFSAPSPDKLFMDPGYQFRLRSGSDALDRSAAARGTLRTGNAQTAQTEYGQNFGAQEYDAAFRRALSGFETDYRGAHDVYAPLFARWQLGAQGLRDAMLAGYQGQVQAGLPHGGGGGDPFGALLPYLLEGGGGPPAYPGGDGGQYPNDQYPQDHSPEYY